MTQQQFQSILQKHRKGLSNPEEEAFINEWYDSIGKDMDLNMMSGEIETLEKKYWAKINDHILKSRMNQRKEQRIIRFSSWKYVAAAAVLLGMVSFVYLFSSTSKQSSIFSLANPTQNALKEVSNSNNQPQVITLQDGSTITLQPGSKISYPEPFSTSQREIYLVGEAFFDVAKDSAHPFLVYSNEVTTKVLGTSFFIKANKEDKEIVVTVKTGRVMVYTKNFTHQNDSPEELHEIVLKPNQQAVYNRKNESVEKKLVERPQIVLAQPTFKMNYNNAPVSDIFEALEESYGVDIQFDKDVISACTLTTDLSEEGLYERIEIICNALGASYSSIDTVIVIEAKSCN